MLKRIAKRILFPHCQWSYSQVGEDRIINQLFKHQHDGFYVDVGCNHPTVYSNTYLLYKSGWTGLAIDAHPEFASLFQAIRPKDTFVECAIDKTIGEQEFMITEDSRLSGLLKKDVVLAQQSKVLRRHRVKTRPLQDILAKNKVPKDFEVLNLDIEGHELSALQSMDFKFYRPKLVIVEIHELDLMNPLKNLIVSHMLDVGYKLHSYALMNAYFTDQSSAVESS